MFVREIFFYLTLKFEKKNKFKKNFNKNLKYLENDSNFNFAHFKYFWIKSEKKNKRKKPTKHHNTINNAMREMGYKC